ncbi:cytochrome P450 [Mycobacterium conspicuum]|uniref:Putative cytochrome P450 135B1 n=1 Tax=Mycobacterium conspicuum TaxID=44010 RepID=A0A7I7YHC3_9MYCO|nr:cytochrome P450 [Mycobacterium conspicuum]BBZ40624.1 putative cytochrome P450 135B1 [Mycobacterium conspicuum]
MVTDTLPPGPRLPMTLQTAAWIARPWDFMTRCAAQYGDMFTMKLAGLGAIVMVSHPEVVREVFTASPELLHAGEANRVLLPVVGANSVMLLDGDAHREQRRLLVPSFRGSHLQSYMNTIRDIAEAEIARWPRGEPVRLLPQMQTLTLEVILRVVFGLEHGERLDRLRAALLRMLALTMNAFGQMMMLVVGPERMRTALTHRVLREVDRLLYEEIAARRQADDLDERRDVLSMLLRAKHADGQPMSDGEIRDELITLLLAGHETTASGLAWAVERIIRHPDIHSRLVEAARADAHEYIDAVVKESLRLRPVVSLVGRRLKEPAVIGGVPLPAGAAVVPSIYLMHRRPEIYPDPEQFRPERFLGDRAGTYTWIPFGGGVRRCLGATFAEFEMRIVLAALFASNQLRPDRPEPEPVHRRSITHVPGRGTTAILR